MWILLKKKMSGCGEEWDGCVCHFFLIIICHESMNMSYYNWCGWVCTSLSPRYAMNSIIN